MFPYNRWGLNISNMDLYISANRENSVCWSVNDIELFLCVWGVVISKRSLQIYHPFIPRITILFWLYQLLYILNAVELNIHHIILIVKMYWWISCLSIKSNYVIQMYSGYKFVMVRLDIPIFVRGGWDSKKLHLLLNKNF